MESDGHNVIPFPGAHTAVARPARPDDLVSGALKSGWLTHGDEAHRLQTAAAELFGGARIVPVAGGTAALHLALLSLDLAPGDEVILPALSSQAVANLVILAGGHPVFADIVAPETPFLDAADAARRIGPGTRAIVVDHYQGFPAPLAELTSLGRRHGLTLIEDCRRALGAAIGGRPVGTFGDIGAFSLADAPGAGGLLTGRDEAILRRLEGLRSAAASTDDECFAHDCSPEGVGGYRIDEAAAANGVRTLAALPSQLERGGELAAAAFAGLAAPGTRIGCAPTYLHDARPTWRTLILIVDSDSRRRRLIDWARATELEVSSPTVANRQPPHHAHVPRPSMPMTEEYCGRALELVLSPKLTGALETLT